MSAGVPLYLVSACESAEDFVAAFRRYADRTGLFVPVNEPLPVGRRGRIALALKDGGVMIDGEAEVVASKVKAMIKAAGCNTAGDALDGLNAHVGWLINEAVKRTNENKRKTVRAYDF